jgi:hypothetical protein
MEFIKMVCTASSIVKSDAHNVFSDVPESHWGYTFASSAKDAKIIDIYSGSALGADTPITREDMAYIADRAIALFVSGDTVEYDAFDDDTDIAPYAKDAVYRLKDYGIINGKGDGSFGIGQVVTREDMCVMIARVLGMGEGTDTTVTFTDTDAIAPYAQDSVGYLSLLGMVNGMPDGSFQPKVSCTRAQVARVISDIINYNVMEVNGK